MIGSTYKPVCLGVRGCLRKGSKILDGLHAGEGKPDENVVVVGPSVRR